MGRWIWILVLTVACVGCGPHFVAGAGPALGRISVAGDDASAWGPALAVNAWAPDGRAIGGLVAADLQLFRVKSPARAEHFRILHLLPSVQLGDDYYARAGLGPAFYYWGGDDPFVHGIELGVAAGGSAGFVLRREGRPRWSVELTARSAGPISGEMSSGLWGLRLSRYLGPGDDR